MASAVAFNPLTLLSNASATGSWLVWPGGRGIIEIGGTWSSATATLQVESERGTAISADTTNLQWTANGASLFELPPCRIRISISGSPSAMYAYAKGTDAP